MEANVLSLVCSIRGLVLNLLLTCKILASLMEDSGRFTPVPECKPLKLCVPEFASPDTTIGGTLNEERAWAWDMGYKDKSQL